MATEDLRADSGRTTCTQRAPGAVVLNAVEESERGILQMFVQDAEAFT